MHIPRSKMIQHMVKRNAVTITGFTQRQSRFRVWKVRKVKVYLLTGKVLRLYESLLRGTTEDMELHVF